jgi:hypothetical protein
MCVEAAICYALGEPHGDNPSCVGSAIREYKIKINDAQWSSNEARTKGMRRAAIAQLGSQDIDQAAWTIFVVEQVIRRILSLALRAAAKKQTKEHREKLEAVALQCEQEGTKNAAYAAYAAANAATYAANAATYAAAYAAYAAASAATYAANDNVLSLAAEICVEACINFKTQGSKWLDICND